MRWIVLLLAGGGCDLPGDPVIYDLDGDRVLAGQDCDDHAGAVHPGAVEACNGIDDDCDGLVDEGLLVKTWRDADEDGYGGVDAEEADRCEPIRGWVLDHTDCDDADPAIRPGMDEICDGRDQNCNGLVDEGLAIARGWWDGDGDGYGLDGTQVQGCALPPGFVGNASDCDDTEASTHPGADETCNGIDEDCDGIVDNDLLVEGWVDGDGDGWGSPGSKQSICIGTPGFVDRGGDCDDGDPAIQPHTQEICNGKDDDCNGVIDNGVLGIWHLDADGDGYGDPLLAIGACDQPPGYVSDNSDCNDLQPAAFPGSPEICDEVDNDCDGLVDEGADKDWYADLDGDGLGDPYAHVVLCTPPVGFVAVDGDCDDSSALVPPNCPVTLFDDWQTVGNDPGRSGYTRGTVGNGVLTLDWSSALGSSLDPVAVGSGKIFATVGSAYASDMAVVALDLDTGTELWSQAITPAGAFLSGPSWSDQRVCVSIGPSGSNGHIRCLDDTTGATVWDLTIRMPSTPFLAPLVFDDRVYSGASFAYVYALGLNRGFYQWNTAVASTSAAWGIAGYGADVYVWDSSLYALNAATGATDWTMTPSIGFPSGAIVPVIDPDGVAYVSGTTKLVAIDLVGRTLKWTNSANLANGFPAVSHGSVFMVQKNGTAAELDAATGALVRTFAGSSGLLGPPVVTDDALIVSSATTTYVYALDTGLLLQSVADGGAISVAENHLVLASPAGSLHVYSW